MFSKQLNKSIPDMRKEKMNYLYTILLPFANFSKFLQTTF